MQIQSRRCLGLIVDGTNLTCPEKPQKLAHSRTTDGCHWGCKASLGSGGPAIAFWRQNSPQARSSKVGGKIRTDVARDNSSLTISCGSVPGLVSAAHSVGMTNTNSFAWPDDQPWGVLDSHASPPDKNAGRNSDGRRHLSGIVLGYARVSRNEQELARQFDALRAAGCARVFYDKGISGAHFDRPGLTEALNYARGGDTLTVQALDRLGRSTKGVLELAERLERSGVALRILNLGLDTATPSGKLVLTVIAAIAEMERDQLRERTLDGLAAARARGRVGGRPPALTEERRETVRSLYTNGASYAEIARILLVSERTVRRALGGK